MELPIIQQIDSSQQLIDEYGNECNSQTEQKEQTQPRTWSESLPEIVRGNMEARKMFPLSYMELILTTDCNLRCSYCFERDKKPFNMSDEVAFAAVDFLIQTSRNIKELTILLFGGEPMMQFVRPYLTNCSLIFNFGMRFL
jgi:sulfatase maturation enzyme AslB (radical SAM superfamily)